MSDYTNDPKILRNLNLMGEGGPERVYNVEAVDQMLISVDGNKQPRSTADYQVGNASGEWTAVTGAASSVLASTLTPDRALLSNTTGNIATSTVTRTELEYVAGVTGAVQTQLNGKLNLSGGTMTGALTLNGAPTSDLHASTKKYVDDQVNLAIRAGFDVKASCVAATTENITNMSGLQTVDGVQLTAGNRVLVKNQDTAANNGIYVVAAGAWTRAADFNSNDNVTPNAFTFIEKGTANGGTGWVLNTSDPITLGTTALTFIQFSAVGLTTVVPGTGISVAQSGNSYIVSHTAHTGDVTGSTELTIGDGKVTYAKIQQVSSLSVLGNSTATNPSTVSAISASAADHMVLRRSGTTLAFGEVATTGIANSAVTNIKIADNTIEDAKIVSAAAWNAKQGQIPAGTSGNILTYSATAGSLGTPLNPTILYGTCSTAAAAKTVALGSISTGYAPAKGTVIGVTFTVDNSATGTGNITLAVSGPAATAVQYKGAAITASNAAYLLPANKLIYFQYDGTYWQLLENAPLGSTSGLTQAFTGASDNTANRTYPVRVNSTGQMGVSVPWTDTTYTIPAVNNPTITIAKSTAQSATTASIGTFSLNQSAASTITLPLAANATTGSGLVPAPATAGTTSSGFRVLAQNNAADPAWSASGTANTLYLNGAGGWTAPTAAGVDQRANLSVTTAANSVTGAAIGVTGTLPVANGGLGVASLTTGQLLVSNTASPVAVTTVAGNANTSYVLKSGGVNAAPVWGLPANVSGTAIATLTATAPLSATINSTGTATIALSTPLGVQYGGIGVSSIANTNAVLLSGAGTTVAVASVANSTSYAGYVLTSNGTGAPTWQSPPSGNAGLVWYATNSQSQTALTLTIPGFTLTTGVRIFVLFTGTYTSTSNKTLNVNSTGALPMYSGNTQLTSNNWGTYVSTTKLSEWEYNGARWNLLNPEGGEYRLPSTVGGGGTGIQSLTFQNGITGGVSGTAATIGINVVGSASSGSVPNPDGAAGYARILTISGTSAPAWTTASTNTAYRVVRTTSATGGISLSFGTLNNMQYFGGTTGTAGQYLRTADTNGGLEWGTISTSGAAGARGDIPHAFYSGTFTAAASIAATAFTPGATGFTPTTGSVVSVTFTGGINVTAATSITINGVTGTLQCRNSTAISTAAVPANHRALLQYGNRTSGTTTNYWTVLNPLDGSGAGGGTAYLPLTGGTLSGTLYLNGGNTTTAGTSMIRINTNLANSAGVLSVNSNAAGRGLQGEGFRGVFGNGNTATGAIGVLGQSSNGPGVYGYSAGSEQAGVRGFNEGGANGVGVFGIASGAGGVGVYAEGADRALVANGQVQVNSGNVQITEGYLKVGSGLTVSEIANDQISVNLAYCNGLITPVSMSNPAAALYMGSITTSIVNVGAWRIRTAGSLGSTGNSLLFEIWTGSTWSTRVTIPYGSVRTL